MNNISIIVRLIVLLLLLQVTACKKNNDPVNFWVIEGLTFQATGVQKDTLSPSLNAVYYGDRNGTPSGGLSFRFQSLPIHNRTYKAVGISQLKIDELIVTATYGSRTLRSYASDDVIVEVNNEGHLHISVSGLKMRDAANNNALLSADINE